MADTVVDTTTTPEITAKVRLLEKIVFEEIRPNITW